MSIQIQQSKCKGCGRCMEVCPGNLIVPDKEGKAMIVEPKDCWGCTSCVKECKNEAIYFYLGADIGGLGSRLSVRKEKDLVVWKIQKQNGALIQIPVDPRSSNKY